MKLNCKPGDLVILLRAKNPNMQHMVGQIKVVGRLSEISDEYWRFSPDERVPATGNFAIWRDADMRPLRDNDGEDETLQWVPRKVKA